MAEIVGVVAAAAQLATACLGLLDATKRIKRAPQSLQRYQVQLENIQHISFHITQNPLLQTVEVEAQTKLILSLIEESSRTLLTAKSRLSQFWTLVRQEQTFLEGFNTLERHKTSLLLVIDSIQASTLHSIRSDIGKMADIKTIVAEDTEKAAVISETTPAPSSPGSCIPAATTPRPAAGSPCVLSYERFSYTQGSASAGSSASSKVHVEEDPQIIIEDPFAGHGCAMYNGHRFNVGPGDEPMLSGLQYLNAVTITNPVSKGAGETVNGMMVETEGAMGPYHLPRVRVHCVRPQVYPVQVDTELIGGSINNGVFVRRRGEQRFTPAPEVIPAKNDRE